jgi:hypothetical protein
MPVVGLLASGTPDVSVFIVLINSHISMLARNTSAPEATMRIAELLCLASGGCRVGAHRYVKVLFSYLRRRDLYS